MGVHTMAILRHGKLISEAYWTPYAEEKHHVLYSASKTFTGLAVGFAVEDGLLKLTDRVVSYFPERLPAKHGEYMEKMTVWDMLTMSTGFAKDPHAFEWPRPDDVLATGPHCCHEGIEPPRVDWIRNFFNHYVAYEPGTEFVYCTHGTFMLSVIVQKVTGKTVSEYMNEKLFGPLGLGTPFWESNPDGYTVGGWGLMLTAEQLAVVGQWMLNRGKWNGVQLLSEEWIRQATSVQMEISHDREDYIAGYGYQMWICDRYGAFFFRGAFGQVCAVIPEKDMVFAYTGANDKATRKKIWESIMENILEHTSEEPLPEDPTATAQLAATIDSLGILVAEGTGSIGNELAAAVSGKHYCFGDNRLNYAGITMTFAKEEGENDTFTLYLADGRSFTVPVGYNCWLEGKTCVDYSETDTDVSLIFTSTACSGAWKDGHYILKVCFDETNYINTFDLEFRGNAMILHHSRNNSFYEATTATLVGVEV